MGYKWVLVFLLNCGLRFGEAVQCNIYLNDDPYPISTWDGQYFIGNFRKDIAINSLLPGYIRVEGVTAGQMKPASKWLCSNPEYFTPDTTIPNEVHFKVTDMFQNIDIDNVENSDPTMVCMINLGLDTSLCDDASASSINLIFVIEEFNTHDPVFLEEPIIFNVAAPLQEGVSLSALSGVLVRAQDIDIGRGGLNFEVESDSRFDFKYTKYEGRKTFNSDLVLTSRFTQYLQRDLEMNITVYDPSLPSTRQASTTLKIVLDQINSLPPTPEFASSFDSGKFNVSDLVLNAPLDLSFFILLKDEYLDMSVGVTDVSGTAEPHFRAHRTGTNVDILYVQEYTEDDPAPDILTLLLTAKVKTFGKTTSDTAVLQLIFTDQCFCSKWS